MTIESVHATVATLAASIANPAVAAAWQNYAAAQAARDSHQDARLTDLTYSLAKLRGDQDRAIDAAVTGAIAAHSIRASSYESLVDSVVAQSKLLDAAREAIMAMLDRMSMLELRGDMRTELLLRILERLSAHDETPPPADP
jgi:hypothetical protein